MLLLRRSALGLWLDPGSGFPAAQTSDKGGSHASALTACPLPGRSLRAPPPPLQKKLLASIKPTSTVSGYATAVGG